MITHFAKIFPLLLWTLVASSAASAPLGSLSAEALEYALGATGKEASSAKSNAERSCSDLSTLRSTDLLTALTELYQDNEHRPLWQDPQRLSELKRELEQLDDDGLERRDYRFALQATAPMDYCAELRVSSQYLLALEHLSRGRLVQSDHEPLWQADMLPSVSVAAVSTFAMTGLAENIAAAFEKARPGLPAYRNLRAAYAATDRHASSRPDVPSGPLLRPGMSDERVGLIAKLLQQDGFLSEAETTTQVYDQALEQAVRRFQASHGLQVDAIIGPQTLSEMNVSPAQRVRQMQVNLERLRWINALRSDYLLLVNVASGHIQLLRGNDPIWQARAQTGRPSRPTPLLVSRINRISLNPSWTVPPTILREDTLPQIRRNPDYLDEHNMLALDTQGNRLDPQQINWNNPRGVILRQQPGPSNPLGQLVFRLPNPFSIYLHDTPSQHLFQQANRNLSSGCVRVEAAEALADHLMAELSDSQRERIAEQLASGQTHEISLTNGPQVIIAYWTAFADAEGRAAFVPDRYGLDRAIEAALADLQNVHGMSHSMDIAALALQSEAGCAFSES